ncbi:MAG: hypothetical protein ACREUC_07890, partial [Steroidobacteraceae bacterium]
DAPRSPFAASRELSSVGSAAQRSIESDRPERPTSSVAPGIDFSRRQAIYEKAGAADQDELDSLIAQAKALPDGAERRSTLEILLLRYAQSDFDGAMRHAMGVERTTAASLITALASTAPERAWERVSDAKHPAAQREYRSAVVSAWVAREPELAFANVVAMPVDWQRTELLQQATAEIARRDPRLAIELVGTIDAANSEDFLDIVAQEWARRDPAAAARWVESYPQAKQARFAYKVADAYVAQNPTEALAWAVRISQSPRRYLWAYMLGKIALYDPHEALRLANAADSPVQRSHGLGTVLGAIAQRNPELATAHLAKVPAGRGSRGEVLMQIANGIVTVAPTAAIDWLNSIDDEAMRVEAANYLGSALARADVEAAAQLIDRIPKEARGAWISSVALGYADHDIEKGRLWIRKYSDERSDAAFQFARTVASRNPEAALQLLDGVTDEAERNRLMSGMMMPLAEQSPELAARWAERITDNSARERAVGQVASVWRQYDWPAARKWALSLEDGPARDAAVMHLAMNAGNVDETLSLINQVQSPERRMDLVMRTAMQMAQSDPQGARTLIRRHPLDPQRQHQLDRFLQQRRD